MRVVLFDIDGTLLSTQGAGKRAMESALAAHFGTTGPAEYHYGGKTDRQIVRDLMRGSGFADDEIDARMPALLADYLDGLRVELTGANGVDVHPGVTDLLDALEQRTDVLVGLLTGNIEHGAHAKLTAGGLPPRRFRVGAFGSDHERRDALPAIAQSRAAALLGRAVAGERLVIIGDTPLDIECGRGVRARALAVATGSYSVESLAAHAPAAVFESLADTERVMDSIFEQGVA